MFFYLSTEKDKSFVLLEIKLTSLSQTLFLAFSLTCWLPSLMQLALDHRHGRIKEDFFWGYKTIVDLDLDTPVCLFICST